MKARLQLWVQRFLVRIHAWLEYKLFGVGGNNPEPHFIKIITERPTGTQVHVFRAAELLKESAYQRLKLRDKRELLAEKAQAEAANLKLQEEIDFLLSPAGRVMTRVFGVLDDKLVAIQLKAYAPGDELDKPGKDDE